MEHALNIGQAVDVCKGKDVLAHCSDKAEKYILPCGHCMCANYMTQLLYNQSFDLHYINCIYCAKSTGCPLLDSMPLPVANGDAFEEAKRLFWRPELSQHLIIVNTAEAREIMGTIHECAADRLILPEQTGSMVVDGHVFGNAVLAAMKASLVTAPAVYMTTPIELEQKLLAKIDTGIMRLIMHVHIPELSAIPEFEDAFVTGKTAKMVRIACDHVTVLKELGSLWFELIAALLGMLIKRHLTRLEGIDGDSEDEEYHASLSEGLARTSLG